jgi:hypothetical protein
MRPVRARSLWPRARSAILGLLDMAPAPEVERHSTPYGRGRSNDDKDALSEETP